MNTEIIKKYKEYILNNKNNKQEILEILINYQNNCNTEYRINDYVVKEIKNIDFKYNNNIENIIYSEYSGLEENIDNRFSFNILKEKELAYSLLYLLPSLKNIYLEEKIDLSIFYNTLEDLFFHLNKNFISTGKLILSLPEANWLLRIFHMKIFKLGQLQYELVDLERKNKLIAQLFEKININYPKKVIAIHIMVNSKLTTKNVDDSIKKAKKLFNKYSDFYYCYSWLLFDPMLKFLTENSNIYNFSTYFNIVENIYDNKKVIPRINTNKETILTKLLKSDSSKLGIGLGILSTFKSN